MSKHRRVYEPVIIPAADLFNADGSADSFWSMVAERQRQAWDNYAMTVEAWLTWQPVRPLISSRGMSRKQQRRRGYVAKAKRPALTSGV